ncbi:MAG: hypothetical protein KME23_07555 [Goleter apudmare HA4340-LM2]|jgi:ATP-binding cassette subfamily B protein|nr:hypothetical protein [Goleter apudmare HA4340-LM2]
MASYSISQQHPLLRLLNYAKNYRPQVWTAATFTILNTIFDLAPAYLIGLAVDIVAEQESSIIAQFGVTNIIGQLAILTTLLLICSFTCGMWVKSLFV